MKNTYKLMRSLAIALIAVGSQTTESNADIVLNVEIDTVGNTLSIIGTEANSMATFATGNFPYVELAGFFSDTTNTLISISSPSSESLSDFEGNTYQYLFDADWFISTRPDSLSMLNRTLNVHSFDASQAAFTGATIWSISGAGIELSKINSSGNVYANENSANDGSETLIGTWQVVPEPSSYVLLLGFAALGYVYVSRRGKNSRTSRWR